MNRCAYNAPDAPEIAVTISIADMIRAGPATGDASRGFQHD
jgi:hypothetical protein